MRWLRSLLLLAGLYLLGAIVLAGAGLGLASRAGHADAALLFGNTVEPTGQPSARLTARLEAARALYVSKRVRYVVASGGTGREGFDEARVMRRWLAAHGVADSAVIEDSHGGNTLQTCINARILLAARHASSVDVVTQYFHVPRGWMTARRAGLDVAGAAAPRFFEARDLYSLGREVIALPVYAVSLALRRSAPVDPAVLAQADLDAATRAYAERILLMDAAGIAQSFTTDGETQDGDRPPIQGPAAILVFLKRFRDFHVLSNALVPDSTTITGDRAHQDGWFRQTVRIPDGKIVEAHGTFEADWRRVGAEWRLERMHTRAAGN